MGPVVAVTTVFSRYASFRGRAVRSEFWWFTLLMTAAFLAAERLDRDVRVSDRVDVFTWILIVALAVPSLTVTVRRLHDTGRSGWWWWIAAVPLVGPVWLLVLLVLNSQPTVNRYGPPERSALVLDSRTSGG